MKKVMAILLALLLLLSCAAAEEADVVIVIPGMQIRFAPMEGAVCLTRDSSASAFNRAGLSQREILPYMVEYDMYAMLYDAAGSMEMQLCAYPVDEPDYSSLTAFEVSALCDWYEEDYVSYGYSVEQIGMVKLGGTDYVRMSAMHLYEDGYAEHMLYYSTVRQGFALELVVFPFDGPVTDEIEETASALLESLQMAPLSLELLPEGYAACVQDGFQAFYAIPEGMSIREEDALQVLTTEKGAWEIRISAEAGEGGDLDVLSPEMAKMFCEDERKARENTAESVTAMSVYETTLHRYLRTEAVSRSAEGTAQYVDEYYTKQDGWDVYVRAVSTHVELPDEAARALQELVDSMMIYCGTSEE